LILKIDALTVRSMPGVIKKRYVFNTHLLRTSVLIIVVIINALCVGGKPGCERFAALWILIYLKKL